MSLNNKTNPIDILSIVLTIIGVVFIVSVFSKILKEFKKTTSSELVSEEGRQILNDPIKRKKLREAVDHYHKSGNWDKLSEV